MVKNQKMVHPKKKHPHKKWTKVKGRLKVNIPHLVIGGIVFCLLLVSLIFAPQLEVWLLLKPNFSAIDEMALTVHVVNVGQGDAMLVRLPNGQTMMIDSGPVSAKDDLLFYIDHIFFQKDEPKQFDYVILTHSDADHSGNMLTILNNYPVYTFFRPAIYAQTAEADLLEPSYLVVDTVTYENLIVKLQQLQLSGQTTVLFHEAGLTISDLTTTYCTFLTPNVPTYSDTNDFSPVLLLQYLNKKIMLTGDISSDVELEVLNNNDNALLDVDVLKLAHHGSSGSTSSAFLQVVKPEYAFISVGQNSYGQPSDEVYDNLYAYGVDSGSDVFYQTLTTLDDGNLIYFVNTTGSLGVMTLARAESFLFISYTFVCLMACTLVFIITIGTGVRIQSTKASNV